jgi:hypothetical protein
MMDQFHTAEYTERVMATVEIIRNALGETDFDVGANALMTVLAQCGKQSTLTTEEFLTAAVVQIKHLMDNMTVFEHPIQ